MPGRGVGDTIISEQGLVAIIIRNPQLPCCGAGSLRVELMIRPAPSAPII
jgi:hypothetical protein